MWVIMEERRGAIGRAIGASGGGSGAGGGGIVSYRIVCGLRQKIKRRLSRWYGIDANGRPIGPRTII